MILEVRQRAHSLAPGGPSILMVSGAPRVDAT